MLIRLILNFLHLSEIRKIRIVIHLILNFVEISTVKKFSMGKKSSVGPFSRILFSGNNSGTDNLIKAGDSVYIGRNCELQVWDNQKIIIKDFSIINDGNKF